jgi:PmbA protein
MGVGLRLLRDHKLGFSFTSDLSENGLKGLFTRALSLLEVAERDEYHALAEPKASPCADDLMTCDPALPPTPEKLADIARAAEEAALAVPQVTKTEGARASHRQTTTLLMNSKGVDVSTSSTLSSVHSSAIAEKDGKMEAASSGSQHRFMSKVYAPERIGREAGEWAAAQLGGEPVRTGQMPVVFDPRIASLLVAYLADVLDGERVLLGTSYLAGKLGQQIAGSLFALVEDPHTPGLIESSAFDGEGNPTRPKRVFDAGVLTTYFYHIYSANKAGVEPTGNAARPSFAYPPVADAYNLHVAAGEKSAEEIVGELEYGYLVRDVMGGVPDPVTGNLSLGSSGFLIENGKVARPVSRVTIAGNILDLLAGIDAVGSDLDLVRPYFSPTLRVKSLTVSGT